jgi:hypothetical protein
MKVVVKLMTSVWLFLLGFKGVWRVLDRPYTSAAEPSFLLTVLFEDGSTGVWECCMIGFKSEGNGLGKSAAFEGFSGAYRGRLRSSCQNPEKTYFFLTFYFLYIKLLII